MEIAGGHKIHIVEAGTGPPVVILHSAGTAAYPYLPLLERLEAVRAIAPDRLGSGLSDPFDNGHTGYRDWAVEVTGQILDALGVDQVSLAGASGGGVWAIWYALAFPECVQRLILLTGIPALAGTHVPLSQRLAATPIIGDLMALIPANEKMIVEFMGMMGEKETIVNYPMNIKALVASSNDPVASRANRTEMSALVNLLGWRKDMNIRAEDLKRLVMPMLLIWGKWETLGGEDVGRAVSEAIPNSVLEVLPAGHGPWLGYPDKTASLLQEFVLSR